MKIEKHISAANKVFNKKHTIASLVMAYISGGMCTVGNLFVQYSFPIKIKGQGCIDWLDLRAVLKAGLTHGEITIAENEVKGIARLYCNTTLLELEAETHTDYPLISPGPLDNARAFPCNLLLTALKFTTPVDPDMGLVPLNGVHLSEGRVTACNHSVIYQRESHQPLIKVTLDPKAVSMLQPCGHVTIEVEEIDITPTTEDIENLRKILDQRGIEPEGEEISQPEPQWIGPKHSVLKMEDAVIVARNIDNTYPNAAAMFFSPNEEVSLNRRMMNAALERLAPVLNDTSIVTLKISGYKAELSAESENPDKFAKVDLGEVMTLKDFERQFNANNLALAMTTDPDEFLLAWSYLKDSPVYVNGNLLYSMRDSVDE